MGRTQWRSLMIDGQHFEWFLPQNELFTAKKHIRVRAFNMYGQPLFVDPDEIDEIRPRSIRQAVLFALTHGWVPSRHERRPLYIGYHRDQFVVLSGTNRFTQDEPFI